MIAFEINIKGEPTIIAGLEEISVLAFILSFRKASGKEDDRLDSIDLSVTGLLRHRKDDCENLTWLKGYGEIGDEFTIRIIETDCPTLPMTRKREDPNFVEKQRRKYYESLKKEYEGED